MGDAKKAAKGAFPGRFSQSQIKWQKVANHVAAYIGEDATNLELEDYLLSASLKKASGRRAPL
ncbi:MAG: hypothetical protein EPO19_01490 [Betaproteobacteria bacterium]|nr:MAG: hypothetical protein EPO19_01490 [Betaproteobacteria bacterium]